MAWELRQSSWNKYGDAYFDANLETYGVIFHYQHMKFKKSNAFFNKIHAGNFLPLIVCLGINFHWHNSEPLFPSSAGFPM